MNQVKQGLNNQGVGLLPLLLFLFLDNYFSYLFSFAIGVAFCAVCLCLYRVLIRDRVYQFMLLPSAYTLVLYAVFICCRLEPVLQRYSPLVTEVLLVVVLAVSGFTKQSALRRARDPKQLPAKRVQLYTSLHEFYFVAQLTQSVYTLHLFAILLYSVFPDSMQNVRVERFLYRELGVLLGVLIILYEQIRLGLMGGRLEREVWLPVLDEGGKVIGRIARSVSRSVPKRYYHPVIRVAVLYKGMLYLMPRGKEEHVSPGALDYPLHGYVRFRQSLEQALNDKLGPLADDTTIAPRLLIRYKFENERVKHFVSLYVVSLRTEEQLAFCARPGGKLWTTRQIEQNIGSHLFSAYFENEFAYLQNTIFLAERFCCEEG